ncbi:FadR/GntR family transcriptional regulator [Virgibacillus alimentarius]|uniref:FadR/GntR family transcriptional regulator n=1 Tax=Virgibacillus alimentarius TaxID=698769 RepID=UPI000493274D|nr:MULTISPECIES: FadR/GntR family transcriptional regulator [Virgibacillus]HLR68122.1 FadR/GntR family transcriptional regulator [Virgibacillus sp.]
MEYKPIKPKKIYEEVADALIDSIKNGYLKPGDKLDSVAKLAENFRVSQSVIREALSGLRAMGLIHMRQGEGTYVTTYDASRFSLPVTTAFLMKKEDVKELFEVRRILEVGAVALAATSRHADDLKLMEKRLEEMVDAIGDGELGERADFHFHQAIVNATHNDMLINLLNSVSEMMVETIRETRKVLLYAEGRDEQLLAEHRAIYQAIKGGDADLAQRTMFDHIVGVEALLFKYI